MRLIPALAATLILTAPLRAADGAPSIRFGRDILPILSANCFECHGPDEKARKAKLRLDIRDSALTVITPGKSGASELVRRITVGPDEVMPPPRTNRKLTAPQKEMLRRWIDEGAAWGKHWAYETPVRPARTGGEEHGLGAQFHRPLRSRPTGAGGADCRRPRPKRRR